MNEKLNIKEPFYAKGDITIYLGDFLKKNLKQTESGKKMFVRMYKIAKTENNREIMKFCEDLLNVYEKYNVNEHIKWVR